eukprot:SAG22_NODE_17_length_32684_cov_34.234095_18_plen_143_part_00
MPFRAVCSAQQSLDEAVGGIDALAADVARGELTVVTATAAEQLSRTPAPAAARSVLAVDNRSTSSTSSSGSGSGSGSGTYAPAQDDVKVLLSQIERFSESGTSERLEQLEREKQRCAARRDFRAAAALRDQISVLQALNRIV